MKEISIGDKVFIWHDMPTSIEFDVVDSMLCKRGKVLTVLEIVKHQYFKTRYRLDDGYLYRREWVKAPDEITLYDIAK